MPDIFLEWDEDFQIDASGDLLTVTGDDEVRQLLERRLFTAIEGYVWHPEYGAGLPQKIGSVFSREQIQSIVNSQVASRSNCCTKPATCCHSSTECGQPSQRDH